MLGFKIVNLSICVISFQLMKFSQEWSVGKGSKEREKYIFLDCENGGDGEEKMRK